VRQPEEMVLSSIAAARLLLTTSTGSDIDTLVVAPRHVKREDFFDVYPAVLRKIAPDSVSSLTAVPDSFVPIIKLVFNDIDIDLIFVSIASLHTIPLNLELKDNKLLDSLDQPGVRAITGPVCRLRLVGRLSTNIYEQRVTDEILDLVPQQKTFRTALRAIKLWAQRRAVYANILGFPGGVAWAMLVARVCQLYPHATGGTIVGKFFYIIKQWNWPSPIMLKSIDPGTGKEKVWNPQLYSGDKRNIMPIITPAYPSMCATYNISKSGKSIILKELERGNDIVQKIFENKLQWKDLFQRHTFFTADHKYYLNVVVSSSNKEAKKSWSGLVESKVRILVMKLEEQADMIELARPFTKGYERVHKTNTTAEAEEVKKGSVKYQVEETKTIETTNPQLAVDNAENGAIIPEVKDAKPEAHAPNEPETIYTTTFYVGIDLTPQATKNLNISAAISHFRSVCTSWPNFNEDLHELNVVPCKK
jgi:poly(A) polymerase